MFSFIQLSELERCTVAWTNLITVRTKSGSTSNLIIKQLTTEQIQHTSNTPRCLIPQQQQQQQWWHQQHHTDHYLVQQIPSTQDILYPSSPQRRQRTFTIEETRTERPTRPPQLPAKGDFGSLPFFPLPLGFHPTLQLLKPYLQCPPAWFIRHSSLDHHRQRQ